MAPVREEQVRFSVSVGDGRKLEGDGQMMWSDMAKKVGGLRFVNPSQELRDQVREWLEETLVTADGKLDPDALASRAKRQRQKRRDEARAEAAVAWNEGALQAPGAKSEETGTVVTDSVPWDRATLNLMPGRTVDELGWRPSDSARIRGTWRGVGAIAMAGTLLVMFISDR